METNNYHDITAEIDAREILRYLNDLGIRNISGEVLKYFITDLKKYIKYELSNKKNCETYTKKEGPERLHSASTFSSRIRSKVQTDRPVCTRAYKKFDKCPIVRNVHSAPNVNQCASEPTLRRECLCIKIEKKESQSSTKPTSSSNNLIKVSIPKPIHKKCDPVALYHYYLSMWQKYKDNVPGENNWSDLRWSVRQKMAGSGDNNVNIKKFSPLSMDNAKIKGR